MAFVQLKEFQKNKKLHEIKNVITPGLNDVLSKHEVSHGINTLKNKFKHIFDDWNLCKHYFTTRPIDKDFVMYSAMDVLDLSELADLINAKIDTVLDHKLTSQGYREAFVRDLSDAYASRACAKYTEVYEPVK